MHKGDDEFWPILALRWAHVYVVLCAECSLEELDGFSDQHSASDVVYPAVVGLAA